MEQRNSRSTYTHKETNQEPISGRETENTDNGETQINVHWETYKDTGENTMTQENK